MTEMLPQPPPNAPAPPAGTVALRSRTWRAWIWGVGIVSVILAILLFPMVTRRGRPDDGRYAVSNLRQMGFALFEFETTYGSFPDDDTSSQLKSKYPSNAVPLGTRTSNDYFRQLLVSEIAASEQIFYLRKPPYKRPDDLFDGTNALEKGECGFAYIVGQSTAGHPGRPIALGPLFPGKLLFDYKLCKRHFNGRAFILRVDNSVTSNPVDKSGKVYIDGKDIFDPTQPFWNGKTPDVKWPE